MDNIIDIRERHPYWTAAVACHRCGHSWQAVAPVGTEKLECPECNEMAGSRFSDRELSLIRALEKIATGNAPVETPIANLEITQAVAFNALKAIGWIMTR